MAALPPPPEDLRVRWIDRGNGVSAVAIRSYDREGLSYGIRCRGYIYMARTKRWSRLQTFYAAGLPRLTREEAVAGWKTRTANEKAALRNGGRF